MKTCVFYLINRKKLKSKNKSLKQVLLVEDNLPTRELLEHQLVQQDYFCVHPKSTFQSALDALQTETFDFLVLDIGLPDGDGLELIPSALKSNADMLILVLTVFAQDELVIQAMKAGAKGYLLKDFALDNIHDVLLSMDEGSSPVDHRVARALLQLVSQQEQQAKGKSDFNLSTNEKLTLQHIAKGKQYKEIAYEMDISINTVREYVRRIYKKMGVNSRAKAVHHAGIFGIDLT